MPGVCYRRYGHRAISAESRRLACEAHDQVLAVAVLVAVILVASISPAWLRKQRVASNCRRVAL